MRLVSGESWPGMLQCHAARRRQLDEMVGLGFSTVTRLSNLPADAMNRRPTSEPAAQALF